MARTLNYTAPGGSINLPRGGALDYAVLSHTLARTTLVFDELHAASPHVFALLGMRNLSAFVGAVFASELADASKGMLMLNPHQDGYPDLLLLDAKGKETLKKAPPRTKEAFSPFASGGLEIKATCGNVPTETQLAKRGLAKPAIGEQRVHLVTGFDWKAHHRETNYLIGLLWDFVDGLPAVTAVTYSSQLTTPDWGTIVQPKEGGGRTTSVSVMARSGIEKMCSNVVAVIEPSAGPYLQVLRDKGLGRASRRR